METNLESMVIVVAAAAAVAVVVRMMMMMLVIDPKPGRVWTHRSFVVRRRWTSHVDLDPGIHPTKSSRALQSPRRQRCRRHSPDRADWKRMMMRRR